MDSDCRGHRILHTIHARPPGRGWRCCEGSPDKPSGDGRHVEPLGDCDSDLSMVRVLSGVLAGHMAWVLSSTYCWSVVGVSDCILQRPSGRQGVLEDVVSLDRDSICYTIVHKNVAHTNTSVEPECVVSFSAWGYLGRSFLSRLDIR